MLPVADGMLRRKIPKTLSGIETFALTSQFLLVSRKIPKTLSGIETQLSSHSEPCEERRKIPKTLSGIET